MFKPLLNKYKMSKNSKIIVSFGYVTVFIPVLIISIFLILGSATLYDGGWFSSTAQYGLIMCIIAGMCNYYFLVLMEKRIEKGCTELKIHHDIIITTFFIFLFIEIIILTLI